jgi:hypothetical protein
MNLKLNMKDINKILAKAYLKCNFFLNDAKKTTILRKHASMKQLVVSPSCLDFSLMFSEGEVKSPCFLEVWWALISFHLPLFVSFSFVFWFF